MRYVITGLMIFSMAMSILSMVGGDNHLALTYIALAVATSAHLERRKDKE